MTRLNRIMRTFGVHRTRLPLHRWWGGAVRLAGATALIAWGLLAPAGATDFSDAMRVSSPARRIELLRRSAWPYQDFLAQVELGSHYASERDFIEAFVWYYVATTNLRFQGTSHPALEQVKKSIYNTAHPRRSELFKVLSKNDLHEAFNRITYVITCRGASGFVYMGERHDERVRSPIKHGSKVKGRGGGRFDPFIGLRKTSGAKIDVRSGLPTSHVDALTYYILADRQGHPYAATLIANLKGYLLKVKQLTQPTITAIMAEASRKADEWIPPFEVYADGQYSDLCPIDGRREHALLRVHEIKVGQIQKALKALGFYYGPIDHEFGPGMKDAISHFQDRHGHFATGHLTALQTVRVIQRAALQNHAPSQTTLGYMYACGIGVVADEVRARSWFERAYKQRYALAAFNLGVLLQSKNKPEKCAPKYAYRKIAKDDNAADRYLHDAALWGFKPVADDLRYRLNHPPKHRHH